jgi:uncharacterized protein YmfQ (DUF2313 family)
MGDTWVARTGVEYAQALRDLLPDGPAWPRSPSSYLQKWVSGNGLIWGDVDKSAAQLLTVDSDPRFTIAMLPDWERNFGLPDPCLALPPQTIADRQAALVAKMTILGGQSRDFFIALAASLGYTVTITEFSPFMCGISQCGDTRNAQGVYRWQIGEPTIRYYWVVNVSGTVPISWFRCGEGQCGLDPMLTIGVPTGLQCRISQWAPAHTVVLFNYSNLVEPEPAPPVSGPTLDFTKPSNVELFPAI